MPPPERPCGRTPSAPKCSSCASEVMKQSVSSPVASSRAPTTSSPSLSEITSHSSRASTSGLTRLTTPCAGAEREPGAVGRQRGQRQRPLAGLEGEHLAERQAALEVAGRWPTAGSVGRSSTPSLSSRPREVSTPTSPRAVVRHRGDDHVVVGAAAAVAGRLVGGRAGQQAAGGQEGEARVVGDLERRGGGGDGGAGRLQQHGTTRACRRSWRPRPARRRRPCGAARRRRGSRRAPRSSRSQLRLLLAPARCVENFVSRRSGMSRM